MSFIAPLFFLGIGLIALPFWLHRLQTETPERQKFASAMFLQATEQRVHVRRQLRHLLLMALRMLFLILLALAFARPFFQRDAAPAVEASGTINIILIDISASMAGKTPKGDNKLDIARSIVDDLGRQIAADEQIELYTSGSRLSKTASTEGLFTTPTSSNYGNLAGSLESLISSSEFAYRIHFISDFQQTNMPDRFADLIPEPDSGAAYEFIAHPIESALENWAIDRVSVENQSLRVVVRGYNTQTSDVHLRAQINEGPWLSTQVEVSAGARATAVFSAADTLAFEPTQNRIRVELLSDDALLLDNRYHYVEDRSPAEPLLILTENPYGAASVYLSALFSNSNSSFSADPQAIASFDARTLNRYSWVIVEDIGALPDTMMAEFEAYLNDGGGLFAASGPRAQTAADIPLSGHTNTANSLAGNGNFSQISSLDNSHPALNGLDGWADLHFSSALNITPLQTDQILAQLDNGRPLLIEQQRGHGNLMILTSSLDNQWNNLPVKPLFVGLMSKMADYLSDAEVIAPQVYAGQTLGLEGADGSAGQLVDPQGNAVLALGSRLQSSQLILDMLGFYQAYTPSGEFLIGSNLSPQESDLLAISEQAITSWQQSAAQNATTSRTGSTGVAVTAASKNQFELWYALMLLALLILIAESMLSNIKLNSHTQLMATNRER